MLDFGLVINYPTVKFHTLATFANLSVEIMAESDATDITNSSTPNVCVSLHCACTNTFINLCLFVFIVTECIVYMFRAMTL